MKLIFQVEYNQFYCVGYKRIRFHIEVVPNNKCQFVCLSILTLKLSSVYRSSIFCSSVLLLFFHSLQLIRIPLLSHSSSLYHSSCLSLQLSSFLLSLSPSISFLFACLAPCNEELMSNNGSSKIALEL